MTKKLCWIVFNIVFSFLLGFTIYALQNPKTMNSFIEIYNGLSPYLKMLSVNFIQKIYIWWLIIPAHLMLIIFVLRRQPLRWSWWILVPVLPIVSLFCILIFVYLIPLVDIGSVIGSV